MNALNNNVLWSTLPTGETNTVNNDLDMNGKRIYNLPVPVNDSEPVRVKDVKDKNTILGFIASAISFNPTSYILSTNVQSAIQEVFSFFWNSQVTDYTELRAYTGLNKCVKVTALDIAGDFVYDPLDTSSTDNGGTIIVAANGKRWKRVISSDVNAKWFGAKGINTDDTSALQSAINFAWNNSKTLRIPSGIYLTTGLTLSGDSSKQNTILKIIGEGFGNPFAVWSSYSGTVIRSITDAPVFQINVPTTTTSAGTLDVQGLVFDGTSTTPVVYLQAFYGVGDFTKNCVFQRGTGHGLQIDWDTTSKISQIYILNKDWVSTGLGSARTGVGLYLSHKYDSGLQTIEKVSSRGFHTAYKIGVGGTSAYTYNASIQDCESSVTHNGIHLTDNARATFVNNCYFEGGDGGVGILDEGDYNKVTNCFTFAGYSTHLKSTSFTYGNVYTGNTFSAGSTPNQVLIDITSTSASGGPGKTCSDNHLSFGGSGGTVAGVIGLRVNGTDPRINLIGNNFNPRGAWVGGAGTTKISDLSVGGVIGLTVGVSGSGNQEIPTLSRGAISFEMSDTGLSQLNVSSNAMTIPNGSLFYCNASSPVTVNRLLTTGGGGRFLIFNTQNTNMTFSNGAFMFLNNGVSFNNVGHIVFYTQTIGGNTYAYELCRSVN